MMNKSILTAAFLLMTLWLSLPTQAQVMKTADLEKYAMERYGDKWLDAAANLAADIVLDKNESLTYQQVIEAPGKSREQLYLLINYWATSTFRDKQAITLNDKEAGCIIISSTLSNIAEHTGGFNRYGVSITPVIKIDIKEGRVRVTYTVQNYEILRDVAGGIVSSAVRSWDDGSKKNTSGDLSRAKNDNTDEYLYDEQWEIAHHYPFVQKDPRKRTCAKALMMTHAYSNAVMDKIEEAIKHGVTGNENDDW